MTAHSGEEASGMEKGRKHMFTSGSPEQGGRISVIFDFESEFHEFLKPAGLKAWNLKNW